MSRAFPPSSRITSLDGLRGIAAFIVVVSHLIAGFFPALFFGAEGNAGAAIQDAIAKSPLFVAYSGTFAVYVFFVLSGFVIASSASRTTCGLPLLVAARYLRLTVPVLVSVCCAFVLARLFPGAPQRASQLVGHWWLGFMYQPLGVSFNAALREAFFTIYWTGLSYFNNVLWTMRIEFAGSVAIYALYLSVSKSIRVPMLALLALLLCFATRGWATNILGFTLGALIFESRERGRMAENGLAGAALVLCGLFLGGLPFAPVQGTLYEALYGFVDRYSPAFSTVRALGAACLLLGVFMWKRPGALLDMSGPQFLGRISFSLYLVHFPLLCLGMSELYLRFGQSGAIPMGLSVLCYVGVTIALAFAFTVLVDEPTVKALGRVRRAWTARTTGAGLDKERAVVLDAGESP